jgi:hypothetical protein
MKFIPIKYFKEMDSWTDYYEQTVKPGDTVSWLRCVFITNDDYKNKQQERIKKHGLGPFILQEIRLYPIGVEFFFYDEHNNYVNVPCHWLVK